MNECLSVDLNAKNINSSKNWLLAFLQSPNLIVYSIIFTVLWETKGMTDVNYLGLPKASLFLLLAFIILVFTQRFKKTVDNTSLTIVLTLQLVLFTYANFSPHEYLFNYTKVLKHVTLFNILFYTICVVFIVAIILKRWRTQIYQFLLFLAILLSVVVIFCSVETGIDTHLFLNMASDYFLQFQNPYTYNYPDIYQGEYSELYGDKYYFNYWPTALYIGSIFRFLFNDVRYAFVAAQIVFIGIILYHRKRISRQSALLISLLWILNMVVLFVNERSWLDALVAPFLIYGIILLEKKKFIGAAILFGIMASLKLYYVFALPFFAIFFLKEKKWKEIFIMGFACIAPLLPYLIFSFADFYQSTIVFIGGTRIREDSLSLVSAIKRIFDIDASSIGMIIMFAFMGLFFILFAGGKNNTLRIVQYMNFTFFVIFLASKQSFCNYFYFNMMLTLVTVYLSLNFDYDTGAKQRENV